MKKTVIAGAMVAAAALPARADWGGLYIGASIGWQHTEIDWRYTNPVPANCCAPVSNDLDDATAGVHFGIQHQWGQIVVGIEASFSGLLGDRTSGQAGCIIGDPRVCETKLGALFTVGPRLGWAPSNQWLLYVTGGYAHSRTRSSLVTFDQAFESHDGWFIGGGVEWALTQNWILGVEYQHVDLGSELHCPFAGACTPASNANNRDIEATADIVRARLSFKLNRPIEPLK